MVSQKGFTGFVYIRLHVCKTSELYGGVNNDSKGIVQTIPGDVSCQMQNSGPYIFRQQEI